MTTSTPIIPPDSPLQRTRPQKNPKLVFTVSVVLLVHLLVLSGLLIQGCKREDRSGASLTQANPPGESTPLPPIETNAAVVQETVSTAAKPSPAPGAPPAMESQPAEPLATNSPLPPAAMTPPADQTPSTVTAPASNAVTTVYVVKRGDNLTKIAKAHGTTVQAIRAANGLKTDRILVGQKLKLPTAGGTVPEQ